MKRKSLASKKVQDPEWLARKKTSTNLQFERARTYDYFVILPEHPFKSVWEACNTFFILFICVTAPWQLAFTDEEDLLWLLIGVVVDLFFTADLVLNFFMAYHDEEFNLIDKRKVRPLASPAGHR